MFLCCFIIWKSVASFEKLWTGDHSPACEIVSQFRELKKLAEAINECHGRTYFWILLNVLTYLATKLEAIVVVRDWGAWVSFMFEFLAVMTVFILASEAARKVKFLLEMICIRG